MKARKTDLFKKRKPKHVYELLVTLTHSEPRIWRQICVPGNLTLAGLDQLIQATMGWTNSHLHEFLIEDRHYGVPDDEWPDERAVVRDTGVTVDEIIAATVKSFLYTYDFGDGWEHEVRVQRVLLPNEELNTWPMCLAGANACPPEDVGGLGGYEAFLQAIGDPSHEEHDAMWRWCGGPFDPRGFDINSANRAIRTLLWSAN